MLAVFCYGSVMDEVIPVKKALICPPKTHRKFTPNSLNYNEPD
jgi:hypothetical protein